MKPLKIILWIGISLAFGKGLNLLFSPSEVIYSFLLSISPFILMGFQQDLQTTRSSSSVFGKRIRATTQTVRVATFWGIPIRQPEASESVDEWFPDTTPQEALDFVLLSTESLVGNAVKSFVTNLVPLRKALPRS